MPAGLMENDTMMSAFGEVPWHRLPQATVVQGAVDVDDVLRIAGIDWTVEQRPIWVPRWCGNVYEEQLADGTAMLIDNEDGTTGALGRAEMVANVRVDTDEILGIVSERYHVVQNAEGLAFLQALMGTPDIVVETAGSLHGNRIVWVCARLDRELVIHGDAHVPYLVFHTGHDGHHGPGCDATGVRTVCKNTLDMGIETALTRWRDRHTSGVMGRVDVARLQLGFAQAYFDRFEAEVALFVEQTLVEADALRVLDAVLPPIEQGERGYATRSNQRDMVWLRRDADAYSGTAWGLLNAVNGYELWDTPAPSDERRAERQALGVINGRPQRLTSIARRALVALR